MLSGYETPKSLADVNVLAKPTIKLKFAGVLTCGLNVAAGKTIAEGFVHPDGKTVGNWYVFS